MIDDIDPTLAAVKERLRIRFALALSAIEEKLEEHAKQPMVLTFIPRAAATDTLQLTEGAEAENNESVSVRFTQDSDRIHVRVETEGFYEIEEMAGRPAFLRTEDGSASYEFMLDGGGCAEFEIENRPEVVEALMSGWTILVGAGD